MAADVHYSVQVVGLQASRDSLALTCNTEITCSSSPGLLPAPSQKGKGKRASAYEGGAGYLEAYVRHSFTMTGSYGPGDVLNPADQGRCLSPVIPRKDYCGK
jgi:hypothetical protein